MRIVGVNGIASTGKGNTDVVLDHMQASGYDVVDVQLPVRHTISAWWGHMADAHRIYNATENGDVIVAHSFGCPRAVEVLKFGRVFTYMFLIRPAMDKRHKFTQSGVYCFHSKGDWPIRFGSWLPFHPFGRAGVDGFDDKRVTNVLTNGGHNADFEENLHETLAYITRVVGRPVMD